MAAMGVLLEKTPAKQQLGSAVKNGAGKNNSEGPESIKKTKQKQQIESVTDTQRQRKLSVAGKLLGSMSRQSMKCAGGLLGNKSRHSRQSSRQGG